MLFWYILWSFGIFSRFGMLCLIILGFQTRVLPRYWQEQILFLVLLRVLVDM
jgi:hypothetical protein